MIEENNVDISQFLYIMNKRKTIIISITLIITLIAGILSFFILSPVYESTVTVIVGKAQTTANSDIQYNDVMMYENLTKTYSEIATSKLVEGDAANKLGNGITADKLNKLISVTPETNTQIIDIVAQGSTPEEALDNVTALSESFIQNANKIYNAGQVNIIDKGQLSNKPVKPRKTLNIAIAFIIGLLFSIGLAFILEYTDRTLKTSEDIKKYLDLPVIGTIPVQDEM